MFSSDFLHVFLSCHSGIKYSPYLRLWALSLAHTELASVFWEKAMLATIKMNNPVLVFIGHAVFACTFAVLLAMDVLECFCMHCGFTG